MENIGEIIPLYFPHLMKGRELIVITRYTSAPDKYNELFAKANARLNLTTDKEKISSLEGYFMHLRDLVYGPNDSFANDPEEIEKGYEFLKLPLDEPHLKIDANKRTIDTKGFLEAGGILSVQGDEIAEIVFFEVDRYFDATDLTQMQIAIQWKNKEDEGSTPAFIRIVEPDQSGDNEKLVFGWPITSEITSVAGPVQFSVRFYDRNHDTEEMNYSLVTLPVSMNIGASLSADLDEDAMDDPRPTILSRLRNSGPLSQLDQAKAPIFVLHRPVSQEIDFGLETSYDLKAIARKNGSGGIISYKWYKADIMEDGTAGPYEGIDIMGDPDDLWKSAGTEDENYYEVSEWISGVSTYYYQKALENGETEWESLSLISAEAFKTELMKRKKLFVRMSVLTLNIKPDESVLGYYRVDARVGSSGTYAYASYSSNAEGADDRYLGPDSTPTWVVKGPEIVDLNDLEVYGNIGDTIELSGANLNTTTSYEWLYCANEDFNSSVIETVGTEQSYTLAKEGYYKAKATNYKNGASNNDETSVITSLAPIADWIVSMEQVDGVFKASIDRDLGFKESITNTWTLEDTNEVLGEGETYTPVGISALRVNAYLTKGNLETQTKSAVALVE